MKVVLATMDHVKRRRKTNHHISTRKDSFMDKFSTQRRGTYTTNEFSTNSLINELYSLDKLNIQKKKSDEINQINESEEINYTKSYKEINPIEKELLLQTSNNISPSNNLFYLNTPNNSYTNNLNNNNNNNSIENNKININNERINKKNSKILFNYKQLYFSIIFHPNNTSYIVWLTFVSLALLYNLWTPIARQAFNDIQSNYQIIWLSFDIIADIIYLIDIFVQCNTSYLKCGLTVNEHNKLIRHYIKSYQFLLDIISLLPLDILQFKYGIQPMLRFPRFFKLYRCREWKIRVENRTIFPNLWRVLNLIHILFLGCHWFAAFYYLLSKYEGFKSSWGYQPYNDIEQVTISRRYLKSFYWATLTLTTIGDLSSPTSSIE
ncbi:unnamed protein product [Heterobilharzia americana]|nr:unnamed protein product [Heterobilharzia americana]